MTETIIVALITGGLSLAGVVVTCLATNRKTQSDIKEELKASHAKIQEEFRVAQAVTDTKIEELTREVREHNNFAKRMPVVENEIKHLEADVHNLQKHHQ
jgi:FtsZ-interacting cell division protein ZipA